MYQRALSFKRKWPRDRVNDIWATVRSDGVGFEAESVTACSDTELRQIEIQGEAESEAFRPDSDLKAVIEAWLKLPAAIKAGILAMIDAAK